jgi:hypothetical protein
MTFNRAPPTLFGPMMGAKGVTRTQLGDDVRNKLYFPVVRSCFKIGDVSRYTDARIRKLCEDALASLTELEMDRIVTELRAALDERTFLAKDSPVGPQARTVSIHIVAPRRTKDR